MIQKLAAMYGKAFSESPVRNTIAGLAGGVVGHGAGVLTALSVAKVIPGLGSLFGIVSLPVVVGASTYAIGRVYLRHFEEGGSIYDIAVDDVRSYYNKQLSKGGAGRRGDEERHAQAQRPRRTNGVDAPRWLGTRPERSGEGCEGKGQVRVRIFGRTFPHHGPVDDQREHSAVAVDDNRYFHLADPVIAMDDGRFEPEVKSS